MKTILVPVDFSPTAESAANYAAELGADTKAKLILLNVYSVPVPVADVPVVFIPLDEVEAASLTQLNSLKQRLSGKCTSLEIDVITSAGFAVEEIHAITEKQHVDLIIMGVNGEGKAPGIFGSNTSAVIKKAKCMVLTVHADTKFKKPEKIGLACDYSSTLPDEVVRKFKEYVALFNSKVAVFDVLKKSELVNYQKAVAEVNLESSLGDMEHSLYYPSGDNLTKEINEFVEKNNIDTLVMVPHNYPFFQNLFHHSQTKEMAFKSKVPLLTIHE